MMTRVINSAHRGTGEKLQEEIKPRDGIRPCWTLESLDNSLQSGIQSDPRETVKGLQVLMSLGT